MRLLLDTHVWLWTMMEPDRLNPEARQSIEREAELILSVASIWEMAIKQVAGKLRIDGGLEGLRNAVRQMSGTELAIRAEHALAAAALPEHHRDPFDRMLVAQAQVDGLVLLTADKLVMAYGGDLIWAGA